MLELLPSLGISTNTHPIVRLGFVPLRDCSVIAFTFAGWLVCFRSVKLIVSGDVNKSWRAGTEACVRQNLRCVSKGNEGGNASSGRRAFEEQ